MMVSGGEGNRLLGVNCRHGYLASNITSCGWAATDIDSSEQGVTYAYKTYPSNKRSQGSIYDDLSASVDIFPVV